MQRVIGTLICASALLAQSPADLFEKAPPHIDQVLRERINKFYQAHVDGKPRLAGPYVAEDTRDFFYEAAKPRYYGFSIIRIDYSENFTKAKATILSKQRIMVPGFAEKPMDVPIPSYWKIVDGQWYWYVDQAMLRQSPFGPLKPGPGDPSTAPTPSLAAGPDVQSLWSKVKADKSSVQLRKNDKAAGQVTIASQMPGSVTLSLEHAKVAGFEATLDRTELKPGEKATVSLRASSAIEKPLVLRVVIQPTNQVIPIEVTVQ